MISPDPRNVAKAVFAVVATTALTLLYAPLVGTIIGAVSGNGLSPFGFAEAFRADNPVAGFLSYSARLVTDGHLDVLGLSVFAAAVTMGLMALQAMDEMPERTVRDGVLGRQRSVADRKKILADTAPWDGASQPQDGVAVGHLGGKVVVVPCIHAAVCAPSGAGKTRGSVYPTVDALTFSGRNSLVVTDPSLEIYAMSHALLERRGYPVMLLDFGLPFRGLRFNPLGLVTELHAAGEFDEAEARAREIGTMLFPATGGEHDFFTNCAASIFSAVAYVVATSDGIPQDKRHVWSVVRTVLEGTVDGTGALKGWLRSFGSDSPAVTMAAPYLSTDGKTESAVLATLHEGLQPFTSRHMRWLTSACDVAPARVAQGRCALFLHTLEPGAPANKVASLFLAQLWAEVQRMGPSRGGSPVWVIGDEWHSVPRFSLVHAMENARKYGVHFVMYLQSFSGLDQYRTSREDGKDSILANCDLKVLYRAGSDQDARYFETLSGMGTVRTQSTGTTRAAGGGSSSLSYSEHQLPVWPAGDILARDPATDGVLVVRSASQGHPSGLYEIPMVDVTKTFVADHYGTFGSRMHESDVFDATLAELNRKARANTILPEAWTPDFSKFRQQAAAATPTDFDEGLAWD